MAVALIVYIHDSEIPSRDEWQRALDEVGTHLILDQFSPREHMGFLPAKLGGQESGFEYFVQRAELPGDDQTRAEIGDRDRMVSFVCHSDRLEGRVAALAAAVLTRIANGVFFDPQGGEFATGDSVFALIEQEDVSERDRRMRLAEKKWGQMTTRRCPRCNAPCPEYKSKCAVCDFAIGRA